MKRDLSPQSRAVLRAAGQLGGLTGPKNTGPAWAARLRKAGAAVDESGAILPDAPETQHARAQIMAKARLARARKALEKAGR